MLGNLFLVTWFELVKCVHFSVFKAKSNDRAHAVWMCKSEDFSPVELGRNPYPWVYLERSKDLSPCSGRQRHFIGHVVLKKKCGRRIKDRSDSHWNSNSLVFSKRIPMHHFLHVLGTFQSYDPDDSHGRDKGNFSAVHQSKEGSSLHSGHKEEEPERTGQEVLERRFAQDFSPGVCIFSSWSHLLLPQTFQNSPTSSVWTFQYMSLLSITSYLNHNNFSSLPPS